MDMCHCPILSLFEVNVLCMFGVPMSVAETEGNEKDASDLGAQATVSSLIDAGAFCGAAEYLSTTEGATDDGVLRCLHRAIWAPSQTTCRCGGLSEVAAHIFWPIAIVVGLQVVATSPLFIAPGPVRCGELDTLRAGSFLNERGWACVAKGRHDRRCPSLRLAGDSIQQVWCHRVGRADVPHAYLVVLCVLEMGDSYKQALIHGNVSEIPHLRDAKFYPPILDVALSRKPAIELVDTARCVPHSDLGLPPAKRRRKATSARQLPRSLLNLAGALAVEGGMPALGDAARPGGANANSVGGLAVAPALGGEAARASSVSDTSNSDGESLLSDSSFAPSTAEDQVHEEAPEPNAGSEGPPPGAAQAAPPRPRQAKTQYWGGGTGSLTGSRRCRATVVCATPLGRRIATAGIMMCMAHPGVPRPSAFHLGTKTLRR